MGFGSKSKSSAPKAETTAATPTTPVSNAINREQQSRVDASASPALLSGDDSATAAADELQKKQAQALLTG